MQVTSNPIPDKQTGLERQVRNKEMPASNSPSIHSPKIDEHRSEKGAAQNETSQYLKVLSRVENLLIQNKLPDAAIEGFAGAIKKQIDAMTEADRQMLMKLPELKMLELDDIDYIPDIMELFLNNIGIILGLNKVGVVENHIAQLSQLAFEDSCHTTHPFAVNQDDFHAVYTRAL